MFLPKSGQGYYFPDSSFSFLVFFFNYFFKDSSWKFKMMFWTVLIELCRIRPAGDPPSPRAAHAATVVGTMVVFQVPTVQNEL